MTAGFGLLPRIWTGSRRERVASCSRFSRVRFARSPTCRLQMSKMEENLATAVQWADEQQDPG